MDVQTAIARIKAAQAEYKALVKSIGTNGLRDLCNEVLSESGATKIRWAQYTPYFNDGDACVFSVNEPEFYFPGDDTPEYELESGEQGWISHYELYEYAKEEVAVTEIDRWTKRERTYFPYKKGPDGQNLKVFKTEQHERAYNAVGPFTSTIQSLQDVLYEVFGDHVQVTFGDNVFEVEDYDHD